MTLVRSEPSAEAGKAVDEVCRGRELDLAGREDRGTAHHFSKELMRNLPYITRVKNGEKNRVQNYRRVGS